MPEEKKISKGTHNITLESRERIYMTGVIDVLAFDEQIVTVETELGLLIIRGINLHVNNLSLVNGELEVDGEIDSLIYEEETTFTKSKGSLFSKLFK